MCANDQDLDLNFQRFDKTTTFAKVSYLMCACTRWSKWPSGWGTRLQFEGLWFKLWTDPITDLRFDTLVVALRNGTPGVIGLVLWLVFCCTHSDNDRTEIVCITCNSSNVYHVHDAVYILVWRDTQQFKFDRAKIAFILPLFYWLKQLTNEGREETGVPGENPWRRASENATY